MGFHLRKSFKCGPFRFNLSNSGIGVSTGVKGLRVGVDGKGRSYIGGGKRILRYRKYLNTSPTASSANIHKISEHHIPKELNTKEGFYFFLIVLMVLGGSISLLTISLGFVCLIIPGSSVSNILFLIGVISLVPFLALKNVLIKNWADDAIKAFNRENYKWALHYFSKVYSYVKNKRWLVRNFVAEKIFVCYKNLNDFEGALKFLQIDNNLTQRDEKIIFCYYLMKDWNKIIIYYSDIYINKDEADKTTLYIIYEAFINTKNYNEALTVAKRLNSRNNIIFCYHQLEDWNTLINYIQKEITFEEKEEHPSYYAMLGTAFLKLGQNEVALETLLSGPTNKRKMDVELCTFRYVLGECYEANGDNKNALKQYEKVYAFDVEYENVKEKINTLKGLAG